MIIIFTFQILIITVHHALYKLETDSGVTTITNVSAHWDGGGLLSFGGYVNCLLKDKNTYFMESGNRYEYFPTNRTGKYGVYYSRLYQVDRECQKNQKHHCAPNTSMISQMTVLPPCMDFGSRRYNSIILI